MKAGQEQVEQVGGGGEKFEVDVVGAVAVAQLQAGELAAAAPGDGEHRFEGVQGGRFADGEAEGEAVRVHVNRIVRSAQNRHSKICRIFTIKEESSSVMVISEEYYFIGELDGTCCQYRLDGPQDLARAP
jgi:hypothetical protein